MAAVTNDGAGYLFTEKHCPICAAAAACSGLCATELQLFEAVLGDAITVERADHILVGARRCDCRAVPVKR